MITGLILCLGIVLVTKRNLAVLHGVGTMTNIFHKTIQILIFPLN
jgi:hypothetical protein